MDRVSSGPAAALWAGLLLLLLLVLSALAVRQRRKHRIAMGDGGEPELARAIRAFGNASEYAPAGMAALVLLALMDAPPVAVHLTGLMLFAGRVLHAVGLSNSEDATLPRAWGIVLTWVAYLFAGVALLLYAVA